MNKLHTIPLLALRFFFHPLCLQNILSDKRLAFWKNSNDLNLNSLAGIGKNLILDLENGGRLIRKFDLYTSKYGI